MGMPYKYNILAEVFNGVDTCVAMFYNRGEEITLSKLGSSVQKIMAKPFLPHYLTQIRCVFPEAFNFEWVSGKGVTVTPNLAYRRALLGQTSSDQVNSVFVNYADVIIYTNFI